LLSLDRQIQPKSGDQGNQQLPAIPSERFGIH
jgi:hypothetical protein